MIVNENKRQVVIASFFVATAFGILAASVRTTKIADDAGPNAIPRSEAKKAPDFSLPDARTGALVHLADATRETPVVFTFWATWCGPCRMELPHLQKLSQKYQGKVKFYGINSSDDAKRAAEFADQNGYTFGMLSDARHQAYSDYGVSAFPTLFVVDRSGLVRFTSDGYSDDTEGELRSTLDKLLSEG